MKFPLRNLLIGLAIVPTILALLAYMCIQGYNNVKTLRKVRQSIEHPDRR